MFAIVKIQGKQYRVKQGGVIDVDLLKAEPGEIVEFGDVLCLCDEKQTQLGSPVIEGCKVVGELVETVAGPKEMSVKYTPRKRNYNKFGHRQKYSRVKITEIRG